ALEGDADVAEHLAQRTLAARALGERGVGEALLHLVVATAALAHVLVGRHRSSGGVPAGTRTARLPTIPDRRTMTACPSMWRWSCSATCSGPCPPPWWSGVVSGTTRRERARAT